MGASPSVTLAGVQSRQRGGRGYCDRLVVLLPWTPHSRRALPAAVWRALPDPGFPASALPGGTYSFLADSIVKGPKNWSRSGRIIFIGTVESTCAGLLDHCQSSDYVLCLLYPEDHWRRGKGDEKLGQANILYVGEVVHCTIDLTWSCKRIPQWQEVVGGHRMEWNGGCRVGSKKRYFIAFQSNFKKSFIKRLFLVFFYPTTLEALQQLNCVG